MSKKAQTSSLLTSMFEGLEFIAVKSVSTTLGAAAGGIVGGVVSALACAPIAAITGVSLDTYAFSVGCMMAFGSAIGATTGGLYASFCVDNSYFPETYEDYSFAEYVNDHFFKGSYV